MPITLFGTSIDKSNAYYIKNTCIWDSIDIDTIAFFTLLLI